MSSWSSTGLVGASQLDLTRLCGGGEAGLAELEPPCSGGCTGFFSLLCPFVLCLFLGKIGFFFKLGNPGKWKKKREAESRLPDSTSHQKLSTLLSPFYTKTLLTVIHASTCVRDLDIPLLVPGDQPMHVDPRVVVLPNRLDDALGLPNHPFGLHVVAQNSERRRHG